MDKHTARDWLLLAYALAELTEIAAAIAALLAGMHWVMLAAAFLLGVTHRRRRTALARADGQRW